MEWLKNRPFLNKQPRALLCSDEDCDPQACYDSFKEHWQQAKKIIVRVQQLPTHDDVLSVMNHLEQMVTLLLYDIKLMNKLNAPTTNSSQCLEYLLNENVLEELNKWGTKVGKYSNAVRCEQLKIYEALVSQSRHVLLVYKQFSKPLLNLLKSCQGELFSKEMAKYLVDLLYQLCALLLQNIDLTDLFICDDKKFIIFVLLITFVHQEDSIGMRARDALLLCMSMSKMNTKVATYIVKHSNFSILVASGLSGLYSVLPNYFDDVLIPDWRKLTPDDVNDVKGLSTFVTSLEFSNAVAQFAHPSICEQLQEFMYRGFLIPVLGPALLQSNIEEQVASIAYLELVLRTVTHPGFLYSMLQFLLKMEYDGQRLMDILVQRMKTDNDQLLLVTISLFETMIDMNCEDLMLELVFRHLQPCSHLMVSQRRNLLLRDPYCNNFEDLLLLSPACCNIDICSPKLDGSDEQSKQNKYQQSLCGKYDSYLCDARNRIANCQIACSNWSNSYNGEEMQEDAKCSENALNSFPSSNDSIGYESLTQKSEEASQSSTLPFWKSSSSTNNSTSFPIGPINRLESGKDLCSSEYAGPLLTIILERLKNYLSNSFYVNLQLTGLISRLAVYPQALLRTYLIDHRLVLQPDVPSLFQIIGSLKQKIDEYMDKRQDMVKLINSAKKFLIEREARIVNARRQVFEQSNREMEQFFQRNSSKRRSLNLPSISGMFGRKSNQQSEIPLTTHTENPISKLYPKFNESEHVALCAVLLDEWVKELAAIAQEHTIAQFASLLK